MIEQLELQAVRLADQKNHELLLDLLEQGRRACIWSIARRKVRDYTGRLRTSNPKWRCFAVGKLDKWETIHRLCDPCGRCRSCCGNGPGLDLQVRNLLKEIR